MNYINESELSAFQQKADAMKRAVLETENPSPETFSGTVYYVSADGDDKNNGLTPQTAIKTMERVKGLQLKRGDAVLFRRGDLFRGHTFTLADGVCISAWGTGPKPTLCGSLRNYADASLWKATAHSGIWACTVPFKNVGLITFDHDPTTIGKYDALYGWLVCPTVDFGDHSTVTASEPPPLHLKNDLEFWTDNAAQILYLRSDENPAKRFKEIEIAPEYHGIFCRGTHDVTIDNLHVTMMGRHGISCGDDYNLLVKNCVLDYIGGSVLWEKNKKTGAVVNVRFGNAVEAYGGCHGFRIFNNWIYQIYDTGITHQCNNQSSRDILHEDVEYAGNLIEYCFWSIEYYNIFNKSNVTRNVYVHDNFCRFGGQGWGCRIRRKFTPMYSISFDAETDNYVTENNIFQSSDGVIVRIVGTSSDSAGFTFRHNTYIQSEGAAFANEPGKGKDAPRIPYSGQAPADFMKRVFHEEDGTFYMTR